MCAEYTLKTSERDLSAVLGRELTNPTERGAWDQHVRLYDRAPILVRDAPNFVGVREAGFSLLPRGSRVPFSANTRLDDWDERRERVIYAYQRPTWAEAFTHRRCAIPAAEFLEPIYAGEFAGQMVAFARADQAPLFIAGIYQETIDRATGEVYLGFSMLTDYPHPFVRQTGHHRTVITLDAGAALRWIESDVTDGARAVEFLVRHKHPSPFTVRPVREMKNWRARVRAAAEKARIEDEIRARVEAVRSLPARG